jgi:outer membrane protein assembly factor BamB
MVAVRFIPDLVPNPPSMIWMVSAFGPFLVGFVIVLWWLLASRALWYERLLGVAGIVLIIFIEQILAHLSMRGPLLIVMTIPMTIAAFTLGLILFGRRLTLQRTWIALVLAALGASVSTLVKSDGAWGDFSFGLDWRWQQTSEDILMAKRKGATESEAIDLASFRNPEWPAFRGPNSDGTQRGLAFNDDWKANPPKELWRTAIGPAWSSFAVAGNYLVTQEQRGEQESVVCYDGRSGQQVWEQSVQSRFFEGLGGLGPRATPTIADGAIFALGAEGWLMKLQASNGDLLWKVDLRKEADREPPMWGFSASPFVHNGLVIVHAGGKGDKGVLAFRVTDGSLAWSVPAGEMSYGSVQKVSLLGKQWLALLSDTGAHFWDPDTGESALEYTWPHQGYRALQPRIVDGDKVLIPTGLGSGTRLVQIKQVEGSLEGEELWTSKDMKPDYNDILLHNGYIYGFDNAIFACIDLKDGKRKWKGGRYEKGQALLLADSGLIVVVSEKGELVLLRANPEKHEELAKIPAMDGKTWNHPVVVGDKLYLRNAEEAVCYQLPIAKG